MKIKWIIVFFILSCGSSDESQQEDIVVSSPPPIENILIPVESNLDCPSGTKLSYENFGHRFLQEYCTQCHHQALEEDERSGATIYVNLDERKDIASWRFLMYERVIKKKDMPPLNIISDDERSYFGEWLNCGAPIK